ncbi:bifunctional acetate--CoA ligase family protein/GNAT family N-acetyltransferase [Sphingomonas sp. LB-2]|uniref:bifunctional acetate--CoA ligase family protein/GNAT family N-acetyltransferase n=1 Tax=Sphingomonas caeni TaxID=2984949 RepID=UPI0022308B42|nr:bifunctional acetate--CoA ligase family protein/GNAT family N-acetyltransferase [Sphingomonas caeni]MCW3848185.1 bifunctional acetate--CoA ligase family protein/GNAT family N-acetyltransferase [Sphingomonas caeni]
MSVRNLEILLHPRSIAVIGASSRPGALGQRVLENVIDSGFDGTIFAVNPKRVELDGAWWIPSVADLPAAPDLAIIVTPAATVPGIITELGTKGTRLAVVISAGLHDPKLKQAMLKAARPYLMRIVGPNCLGVLMPHANLNASFAHKSAEKGGLALISQSGALVTSMVDWAQARGVGFSGVISVGDMADVDLGDLIDLFAADSRTNAIALYIEGITNPAKFMSAARAAARIKPVIVLKAGRSAAAAGAALSHTAAIAGAYDVHLAAFRRAGIVTVETVTELFDAAQVLAERQPLPGNRLAIVTNGGGPGILAVDALERTRGTLASLAPETVAVLDPILPAGWSRANPIDVIGDAQADRFAAAARAAARDPGVDALLVMHCPTAVSSGTEIARDVVAQLQAADWPRSKPMLACWLGDGNADAARSIFKSAKVPLFDNLDDAVRGFGNLVAAREAREALVRAPARCAAALADVAAARTVIDAARADGRTLLTANEAKAILAAFGVPIVESRIATSAEGVADACAGLTPPFAVKVISPTITHKSDLGGVVLNLTGPQAATGAAMAIRERIAEAMPDAVISGFEIEQMVAMPHGRELLVGIADDPTFGPVIAVGAGGVDVELINDRALGLPPLDDSLARDMISRTRIAALLDAHRGQAATDIDSVVAVLNAVSAICVELPDIAELDINPLLVGQRGAVALDARIRITAEPVQSRMVLRPVPMEWAADLVTRSGAKLHVRPVLPSDEWALAEFFAHVSPEDKRFRFLSAVSEVDHDRLVAMTQIDYRRAMNFLAFAEDGTLIATALLTATGDKSKAEFAISVRSDWKGKGVSWRLVEHMLRYAKAEGIGSVESLESRDNHAAIALEREFGFKAQGVDGSPGEVLVRKALA